jgi:hypothetical protein
MAGIGIPLLLPNAYRLNDTKAVCTLTIIDIEQSLPT